MTETRQHKIDRIYEVIKPTEFGRYVDYDFADMPEDYEWTPIVFVMIWDVLDWISHKIQNTAINVVDSFMNDWDIKTTFDNMWNMYWTVLSERKEKRKPIEEQSDDTIDYLYSLLPTEDDLKRK